MGVETVLEQTPHVTHGAIQNTVFLLAKPVSSSCATQTHNSKGMKRLVGKELYHHTKAKISVPTPSRIRTLTRLSFPHVSEKAAHNCDLQ